MGHELLLSANSVLVAVVRQRMQVLSGKIGRKVKVKKRYLS